MSNDEMVARLRRDFAVLELEVDALTRAVRRCRDAVEDTRRDVERLRCLIRNTKGRR